MRETRNSPDKSSMRNKAKWKEDEKKERNSRQSPASICHIFSVEIMMNDFQSVNTLNFVILNRVN